MDAQPPTNNQPVTDDQLADNKTVSLHRGCPPPSAEECERRWAAWYRAMELSHEMLMQGLRQRIGPDGDLNAAYRQWYERYQALKWDGPRAS